MQLSGKVVRKRSYCVRAMGLDLTVLIRGIDEKYVEYVFNHYLDTACIVILV